jgi:hypothetical protein
MLVPPPVQRAVVVAMIAAGQPGTGTSTEPRGEREVGTGARRRNLAFPGIFDQLCLSAPGDNLQ